MKKVYRKPQTEEIEIELAKLIAASDTSTTATFQDWTDEEDIE